MNANFTAHLTTADGTVVFDTRAYSSFIDALYGATFADHIDYMSVTRVRVVDHATGACVFEGPRFAADSIYPAVGCAAPAPVAVSYSNADDILASLLG